MCVEIAELFPWLVDGASLKWALFTAGLRIASWISTDRRFCCLDVQFATEA